MRALRRLRFATRSARRRRARPCSSPPPASRSPSSPRRARASAPSACAGRCRGCASPRGSSRRRRRTRGARPRGGRCSRPLGGDDRVALDHQADAAADAQPRWSRPRRPSARRTGRSSASTSTAARRPPGDGLSRLAGMWVCSAKNSDSWPRSSTHARERDRGRCRGGSGSSRRRSPQSRSLAPRATASSRGPRRR